MPRIPPSLIQKAFHRHVLLPFLLRECRDLASAKNELRWLSEHTIEANCDGRTELGGFSQHAASRISPKHAAWPMLQRNVRRRALGEPLQYILGTQPFGDLEILCRTNVLIPRYDTEAYTAKLAGLVRRILEDDRTQVHRERGLRILDLCTGTGCIALLLHSLLKPIAESQNLPLKIIAVDISEAATKLGKDNLQHNIDLGSLNGTAAGDIRFVVSDIFEFHKKPVKTRDAAATEVDALCAERAAALQDLLKITRSTDSDDFRREKTFDIVISNPPYVSPTQYAPGGTTARSVRRYEPKTALVPPSLTSSSIQEIKTDEAGANKQADLFYPAIYQVAEAVQAQAVVMEVGDMEQAMRVRELVGNMNKQRADDIEVWRDGEDAFDDAASVGDARAIVVWREEWAQWRRQTVGKTGANDREEDECVF